MMRPTRANKPDCYRLGSYRIATAPEPNSSRLTSFKSICFDSPSHEQSLTRLPLELLNGLPQIPAHELGVPIDPVQGARHDVLLCRVDRPGEGFHPIRPRSRLRRRPPRCLHHFVGHPAKEKGIGLVEVLDRVTMQVFVRGDCTMIAAPVQCDVDGVPKGSHFARVPPMGDNPEPFVWTKPADEILDTDADRHQGRHLDAGSDVRSDPRTCVGVHGDDGPQPTLDRPGQGCRARPGGSAAELCLTMTHRPAAIS